MLKLDTIRGHHSTGIARVENIRRNNYHVIKNVGTPWDLLRDKAKEYYNGGAGRVNGDFAVLMGHNRWATVGKIDEENAHPFVSGNILGAHNGTIPDFYRAKLDDYKYYGTDSEAIMYNFDKNGVKETISRLTGAWALTWYNFAEDSFNFLRNKERPLHYAWKKTGTVLYYASEPEFIYMAADKAGVDLKDDEVYEFEQDMHYSFKVGKVFEFGEKNLIKTEVKGHSFTMGPITGGWKTSGGTIKESSVTKSAQESANIFKQDGGGAATRPTAIQTKSKYEEWLPNKGKYVEFTVGKTVYLDEQGKEYIPAIPVNSDAKIRIYPSYKRDDLFAFLGDQEVVTYTGKLKKIKINSKRGTWYMTLDPESIIVALVKERQKSYDAMASALKDLFDDSIPLDKVEKEYNVNGKPTNLQGFKNAVKIGCCWCAYDPEPEDADGIKWYNNETFLCKDCAASPETVRYTEFYTTAS